MQYSCIYNLVHVICRDEWLSEMPATLKFVRRIMECSSDRIFLFGCFGLLWFIPSFEVLHVPLCPWRSSGCEVVKLLTCGARGPGSIPGPAATISEIGCLLLSSRDIAEISLKRRKSSKQPTNNPLYPWKDRLRICFARIVWMNARVCDNYETNLNECEMRPISVGYWVSFDIFDIHTQSIYYILRTLIYGSLQTSYRYIMHDDAMENILNFRWTSAIG